jgi:DmsE family decaheme c-type cytochrome
MKLFNKRPLRWLTLGCTIFFVFAVAGASSAASGDAPQTAPDQPPASSEYVGADTCQTCHEDLFKNLQKTKHWNSVLKTKKGAEAHSCETCHGPGAEHVNSGGDKTKILVFKDQSPEVISKRCLSCHSSEQEHANFQRSAHADNGVSCISCHSPHFAKEARKLLVEKQPLLCYSCHTEQKADFSKPFRHRVNEGLVKCTDCHNVHGSPLNRSLRAAATQDTACFQCHRNLQGPFVFEHVPAKTEGCAACHEPHGSVNPRLLKVNQVNLLCLQCHTPSSTPNTRGGGSNAPAPPAAPVHDQSMKFQACTICHVAIHGSNADETFMK